MTEAIRLHSHSSSAAHFTGDIHRTHTHHYLPIQASLILYKLTLLIVSLYSFHTSKSMEACNGHNWLFLCFLVITSELRQRELRFNVLMPQNSAVSVIITLKQLKKVSQPNID